MAEQSRHVGKCSGRERLIEATRVLTAHFAFDDITIEDIIKEAALSRPSFYYHFAGGKEELRTALIERGLLREKETQDTRMAILEAGVRVFARSGVPAATLDDIATEAGVTRGALCWHFHSKDDLVAAIVKHFSPHSVLRPMLDQIEEDLNKGVILDDETLLRRLAAAFYDAFTEQGDFTRLAILVIYTHPEAAHLLAEMIAKGRKRMTRYIQQKQEAGHFRNDIDAALFVQVMAMTFAMRAIGKGLNDFLPFAHFPRETFIDQLVSLFLYGIAQR